MMKFLSLPALFLIVAIGFISCTTDQNAGGTNTNTNASNVYQPNVYIGGNIASNATTYPVYWLNGNVTVITNPGTTFRGFLLNGGSMLMVGSNSRGTSISTNNSLIDRNLVTNAIGIVMSGGQIVIGVNEGGSVGYYTNSTAGGVGAFQLFTAGTAKGMLMSGTNIYLYGSAGGQATYWVNGVQNTIGGAASEITGMAFSGTNVYCSGFDATSAYIWTNGYQIPMGAGLSNAKATGIALYGRDIYVSGSFISPITGTTAPIYWKNGIGNYLFTLNGGATTAIAMFGSDVYISGSVDLGSGFIACYWKNGSVNFLSQNLIGSTTAQMIVQ